MEIERKWLVRNLPDISSMSPMLYDRYFLFADDKVEVRVQRRGEFYEFERKITIDDLTRDGTKFEITETEFDFFKQHAQRSIQRESYFIQKVPEILIMIYKGDYEGLVRVEAEFEDESLAKEFQPPQWFGPEITGTALARDTKLSMMSKDEFNSLLKEFLK